jgi:hypothetical protein
MNQLSLKKVASVTGLFLGAFALSVIAADWTPPGCAPTDNPGCNTGAPINVSSNQQTKLGALAIRNASQNPNGSSLDVRGLITSTGLFVEGIAQADTVDVLRTLKVAGANSTQENWVLSNSGGGVVEWKAQNTSGVTISEVKPFVLSVPRDETPGVTAPPVTVTTAPVTYLYCALSLVESEMGRVNAGPRVSGGYCQVTKNADGTWQLSGDNTNDPPYKCEMTCFK